MGYLPDQTTLVLAWGPLADTLVRFDELGVEIAGVLGCGDAVAQIEGIEAGEGGFEARDLMTGTTRRVDNLQGDQSRFFFETLERGPRIRRLFMNEAGEIVFERPSAEYELHEWEPEERYPDRP
jgi:hypothetical protein